MLFTLLLRDFVSLIWNILKVCFYILMLWGFLVLCAAAIAVALITAVVFVAAIPFIIVYRHYRPSSTSVC